MPQLLRGHSLYCGLQAPHERPFLDPLVPIRYPMVRPSDSGERGLASILAPCWNFLNLR
jgi:hypothetical protein